MSEKKSGLEMAEEITTFVNTFGVDEVGFAEGICSSHKTLQQSTMRLFIAMCRRMAQNKKFADDRNEAACELAKKITALADENPLPFI